MANDLKRILVITVKDFNSGINKYRILDPHVMLQNLFPNDFYIEFGEDYEILDTKKIKTFDAVFYHNALEQVDKIAAQTAYLQQLGITTIVDIDDFWEYHPTHPYYGISKKINLKPKIVSCLRKASAVITTTEFFASKIKAFNKNVFVIPNSLNFKEKQFKINNTQHELTHIGYVAGVSHLEDVKLLRGIFSSLSNKPTQMQLCGFNVAKDKEIDSTWHKIETQFTDNYRLKDAKYIDYLFTFSKDGYPEEEKCDYRRIWTRPITTYMTLYDDLDICLAPLKDYEFNYYKSNLKLLEAGAKKKPIIASKVQPYLDGEHGKNCLLVEPKKEHKLWIKYVKDLIESPQMQLDLGENLYEYVITNFDLINTSAKRAQVYEEIIKK
jgi:glycosyltransferase involved in cell wall biosynthesis